MCTEFSVLLYFGDKDTKKDINQDLKSGCLFKIMGDFYLKKKRLSSRQPIFIVNLKSNTMKNTLQR